MPEMVAVRERLSTASLPVSPEIELLLCCASKADYAETKSGEAGRAESMLRGEVDWERLLEMAAGHGVAPLLSRFLEEFAEFVPDAVLDRLRGHSRQNKLRNILLAGELNGLLGLFGENEIPIIPYKGPVLAAAIYGDLGLRKAGDLDLLVRKRDLQKAGGLLLSRGYEAQPRLTGAQENAYLRFERERSFVHYERRQVVELQWELMPRQFVFPLSVERLRGRLRKTEVGDTLVPSLSPEDMILVLCVHGTKHFWERLQWVCDVAVALDAYRDEIDWELLSREAAAQGSRRMLALGIFLAHDLLRTELPEEARREVVRDPLVDTLAAEVYGWLFRESPDSRGILEDSAFFPFHFRVRERLRDRLRYLIRTVFTPNYADWQSAPLPRPLFCLYYLLKPVRLVRKYGKRLLAGGSY